MGCLPRCHWAQRFGLSASRAHAGIRRPRTHRGPVQSPLRGGALSNIYRLEEAWEISTQGVHEARRCGDPIILARVLLARGHVSAQMDDGVKQLADADEVLTLAAAGANPRQIGQGLYQRAEALATMNRLDEAAAAVNDVVAYAAPLDLWILATAALNDLIPVQAAQWRFAEAAAAIDQAFACARKTGRNMEASTLTVAAMANSPPERLRDRGRATRTHRRVAG